AEDGIRDFHVTGVQTCALPISLSRKLPMLSWSTISQGASEAGSSRLATASFPAVAFFIFSGELCGSGKELTIMGIVVQKYGGTSVASVERIRRVAERVAALHS